MTLMTLTVLHTNAEEFQKSKGLQFNIPKCKILTILSLLKSCNYLGEKFNSKENNSSLVQCVKSKSYASFSEIISLVKTIINQHHHPYLSLVISLFMSVIQNKLLYE